MKSLLTAGIVFLAGVALLQIIPDADIVPSAKAAEAEVLRRQAKVA